MLDLGITKMALIGVVALVVLGPERLPRVARTAGAVWSRAQRYIHDVKAEVTRELELEELRRIKSSLDSTARDIEETARPVVLRDDAALAAPWQSAAPDAPVTSGVASSPVSRRNWRSKRAVTQVRAVRAAGHRPPAALGARNVLRRPLTTMREPRHYSWFNTYASKREPSGTQGRVA